MKKHIVTTKIIVKENKVGILRVGNVNYISLTDLVRQANSEDPTVVIRNWMSNKNSFDYYGLREEINNEEFNSVKNRKQVDLVFTKKDGKYSGIYILKYPFKIIYHELGINCRFYDLRGSFATKALRNGN